MGEGEPVAGGIGDKARGAAEGASSGLGAQRFNQAIPAQKGALALGAGIGHGNAPASGPRRIACALATSSGLCAFSRAKSTKSASFDAR